MKELWKKKRTDIVIYAVLCILTGITIIVWPAQATVLLCRALGLVLFVMGAASVFSCLAERDKRRFGLAAGVVLAVFGFIILVRPAVILQILAIVIGILLLIHGLRDVQLVIEGKECEGERWWLPSLFATITIVLGLYLIWNYFQTATVVVWLWGLILVFDGISDLVIVIRVNNAEKTACQEKDAVDVDFRE